MASHGPPGYRLGGQIHQHRVDRDSEFCSGGCHESERDVGHVDNGDIPPVACQPERVATGATGDIDGILGIGEEFGVLNKPSRRFARPRTFCEPCVPVLTASRIMGRS